MIIADSVSAAAQMPRLDPNWAIAFTVSVVSTLGLILFTLKTYFPPRWKIQQEQAKAERPLTCEASQHMNRLHERTDRTQDILGQVSKALDRLVVIQESQQRQIDKRDQWSEDFHRDAHTDLTAIKENQKTLESTAQKGFKDILDFHRQSGARFGAA